MFRYESWEWTDGELACTYSLDGLTFTERLVFEGAPHALDAAQVAAARLVFLLAGVSYYKAGAPPVIDLAEHGLTGSERALLSAFYRDGLAEFGYRNDQELGTDLLGVLDRLEIRADERQAVPRPVSVDTPRPLVPFGGGIDSIVVVEDVKRRHDDVALFVMSRLGVERFEAIEGAAAVTGLPIARADRAVDPQLFDSRSSGWFNGHVPVTGILSAVAVLTALLHGRDQVVMSNEWSASEPTRTDGERAVNHQWSKSMEFEQLFRSVLDEALPGFTYYSALRDRSELWVARELAALTQYHSTFRSCNGAFYLDPEKRRTTWCGTCDKCCFVDLVLSPFVAAESLATIFGGTEPLRNPALVDRFRGLLGDETYAKPFECVGDVAESRAALALAAGRADRADSPLVHQLAAETLRDLVWREEMLGSLGPTHAPHPG